MLKNTGERIIPEDMKPLNRILLEHLARYYFALPYATGSVLDIACGTGYGAKMIAKERKKYVSRVLGIDLDPDTIAYAKKNHYHPLLTFLTGDALDIKLPDKIGTFETIISFETMEHVPDDRLFLQNMYNLLTPGGTLVLSTPFGPGRGKKCASPFHFHQLTEEELFRLFSETDCRFEKTVFYYQNGVAVEREKRADVHYPFGIAVAVKPCS